MIIYQIITFICIGIVAGVLGSLLGISGGFITVPCLLLVFKFIQVPPTFVMHLAIGTSLAAMVFNSISSMLAHNKNKAVMWEVVKTMAPGIVVGSVFGAMVADLLSGAILEDMFGFFAAVTGILFFRKTKSDEELHKLPGKFPQNCISFAIAAISNVLGIGGGIFMVPALSTFKIPFKKAIGTSAATGFLITFLGAISYLCFGINETPFEYSIGFLYLPAFIVISIVSYLSAPYGAKLTQTIPLLLLRRLFGTALVITGLVMIFG